MHIKRFNLCLMLLIVILISLLIERRDKNNSFSFSNLKEMIFYHGNTLVVANIYSSMFFPFDLDLPIAQYNFENYEEYGKGIIYYTDNEAATAIHEGLVIERGSCQEYGNYLIVKDFNDVEYIYGFLTHTNPSIYQYIYKDDVIGFISFDGQYFGYMEIKGNEI